MPAPRKIVDLDLDSLENEDRPDPYTFMLGGEEFKTRDPRDLDWQVLADIPDDPRRFLGTFFTDDDYERLLKQPMTGHKLNALMERVKRHYGLLNGPSRPASR